MNEHTYFMTQDQYKSVVEMLEAIKMAECEDFVKSRQQSVMMSDSPELKQIMNGIPDNLHSGASFAYTFRLCQYFLNNPQEWEKQHNRT